MSTTVAPIIAQLTITHASTPYNFGAGSGNSDLLTLRCTLSCDNKAGDCEFVLNDSNGTYDSANGPLFVGGDSVTINIYKKGLSPTLVFAGQIDDVKVSHIMSPYSEMTIHVTDLSLVLLNRLVTAVYFTLDPVNNPGKTVDQIVIDLITNKQRLTTVQNGLNTSGLGLNAALVSGGGFVQPSGIYVQNKTFYNQSVSDCLQELASLALANWYVDASGNVHFFMISNTGTQGTFYAPQPLTNSLIKDMDSEDNYQGIYNIVGVAGGSIEQKDQFNETNSAYLFSQTSYYAVQFTAGQVSIDNIGLLMYKVQTNALVSVVPLAGEIRLDNGNTPQGGATVGTWQCQADSVPTGIGGVTWVTIPCSVQYGLQPGQKYWLIVYKTPQNPNETADGYYLASGASLLKATSSDGVTWSTSTGAALDFRTYYTIASFAYPAYDASSIAAYGSRETVVTDTSQQSIVGLAQEAQSYLNFLAKRKRLLTVHAFPFDTVVLPGMSVFVNDTVRNIIGWFTALNITFRISGVDCYQVDYTLASYA